MIHIQYFDNMKFQLPVLMNKLFMLMENMAPSACNAILITGSIYGSSCLKGALMQRMS